MKRLCEELNVNNEILTVPYEDMSSIIKHVFRNKKYKFYLNSELIDVNNRFRIFKYQNKNYIVKKTAKVDGNIEIEYAKLAEKILDDEKIDDYTIKIVKPEIYNIGKYGYILTEYMGNSLQEYNYCSINKPNISADTIFKIITFFLKKGVLYRGFLPRNTIIKDKIIYLLDWEDAIFDPNAISKVNLLWKTNFILNWSYYYEYDVLEKYVNKYHILSNNEPPLLKYEEKFKKITNLNYDVVTLREFILKTVIESEQKINDDTNDFVIPPNDMAHLVSDLFNSDIDVLFDISSSVLRRKSEKKYIELLKTLSISIVNAYKNNISIQKETIKVILKFIASSSRKKNEMDDNYTILDLYENDKPKFLNELKGMLDKILFDFNKSHIGIEDFARISEYIYSFRTEE